MSMPAIDIESLTPSERLELIGRLWDSLPDSEVPVSDHERQVLDGRLDRIERDGPAGTPWADIEARWRSERTGG